MGGQRKQLQLHSKLLTTTQQHPRIAAAVLHGQAPLIFWLVNVFQSSEISVFNLYWNQVWASVRLRTIFVILSCCISWTPAWGPICASHSLLPVGTSFGHRYCPHICLAANSASFHFHCHGYWGSPAPSSPYGLANADNVRGLLHDPSQSGCNKLFCVRLKSVFMYNFRYVIDEKK